MVSKPNLKMAHDVDPKTEITEAVGDISDLRVFGNRVLVGVYFRPEKMASGLYLAGSTRGEDEYQGRVGLVLKKGPTAFVDDEATKFYGQNIEVGDWVSFNVADGRSTKINGVMCRLIADYLIEMAPSEPDMIY